ncbi:hypothetical protein Fmac_028897 [Flemingia macrophylla]|uniref:Uncharacterized protein n=1 Tax=Flemingia macrophylla TaxID=520843 RepID=A0ABD1L948_9FABA
MVKHVIIEPEKLEDLRQSGCSIYKVPHNLRKVNWGAYTPQWISIGPIHFSKKKDLKPMQKHKKWYFHLFWERVSDKQIMETYKRYLDAKEKNIRKHYAEEFLHISKEIFVEMMLLDAVFIMELLLRNSSRKSESSSKHCDDHDLILTHSWLSRSISRDLILLENQIPFCVLQKLYEVVVPCECKKNEHTGFVDLAIEYFASNDTLMPFSSENNTKKPYVYNKNPKHFTDLIRCFYLPAERESGVANHVPRTATKLQESGVSFEKGEKGPLLEVTFKKTPFLSLIFCVGCLPYMKRFKARCVIPQLKVDHTTECVLRNLIAFEQCHYQEKPYICNYVSLIDSLIHTKDDVEMLVEKEVIVHELGSDKEVATLVNGLCKHVVTNSTCYKETIDKLNNHYTSKWNHTVAALGLVYFRDLWRASSTVVGIAVLVFAVFQFLRVMRVLF